ncbi:helix-turn-helix domain-containing protein (plasmid) [Pseudonocardia sp. DSM 110487]|uniref:helix-turn-helix domain-containing protein n=1 Tax=Pseudonocardia sp. DSM 110487 TaxID=2865833 RepID=UPI001C6A6DA9|nr:helix-turn-helix domain-containing protein [Pseudonocardia sp. DSM 110487]QYN41039.1 helix-turn-helix domain-containing protein [Pseudonocardia sp. DSM 110487]
MAAASTRDDDVPGGDTREPSAPVYRTLQEKLNHLFASVCPPGEEREYTHQEIAELAKAAGHSISASYVNALRIHPNKKPTIEPLKAIAAAFRIPVAYFFDDAVAADIEENLALVAAMDRPEVRTFVTAVAELSPETLHEIGRMIRQARESEIRAFASAMAELSPESLDAIGQMMEQARKLQRLPHDT